MTQQLTSRERMLEAISCREPDYAPCCFMIFSALRSQCKDEFEFVDRQLALGLDVAIGIQSGLLVWPRAHRSGGPGGPAREV